MEDETAIELLREIVDVGPLPTDEPETHPLMEAALAAFLELQCLRAKLARVEALPEAWRQRVHHESSLGSAAGRNFQDDCCAYELERALSDSPSAAAEGDESA